MDKPDSIKDISDKDKSPHFPFIYYCLCVMLYLIALPILIINIFRTKHRQSIPARFFYSSLNCEPQYWFHACSFGEIKSLEPLINASKAMPCTILITTITHTGFKEAKRLYQTHSTDSLGTQARIVVRYLPFEIFLPLWSKSCRQLKTLVVTEAEMWQMLFYLAKSHNAHTLLINARISSRSHKNYQRFAWFYQGIFALIDEVLAQSQIDKERLEHLGAHNVEVFGNLKTLNTPSLSTHYAKPSSVVFIGASTHRGEEKLILEAFKALKDAQKSSTNSMLLLLAPRHPERFKEVYELSLRTFAHTALFSQTHLDTNNADVIIIDTLGELNNLYAISDVVILGGGFAKIGGHNPLEPAFFHTKLISGEHIFNQYALFEEIEHYVLIPPQSLKDTLLRWESLPKSAIKTNSQDKLTTLVQKIYR
ncbi:lipid IV(A) 3-deoxy-D-manno-octulosonic acid transferase [Helicobacter sp. MIT 21-1697]|uniref:lipid IV(A) 3-deoxy-D-manno-octulosonic acid transferase n=1 Tax=Helicobacter sp. MIT 21-1697 TaxID=2993733 RepID=UPI00224B6BCF|nr:lipid IV(A) 3-deoxy-D-manno-octulosonic acid transferase [Helicobacter sp. MIT 21-1697]MCX2716224.1 lipid IV(A) 3-deoxy-D-manno-octulosonic acid transferase [Helicobacter sp. MIT 21-1697]